MSYRKTVKRDKYDILFSLLIRERTNWICEYCQRDFKHNHHGIHCSHLFGRRNKGTRCHPDNAFAHCMSCHRKLEENPPLFADWAREQLGDDKYDRLKLFANKPTKMSHFDKEFVHKFYLSEKKRMLALRADGETGRIEFFLP